MIIADYTVNLAVDYVMYPAVVGAVGLAIGVAVKLLRRVDLGEVKYMAWVPLLIIGMGGIGFAVGDMPNEIKIEAVAYKEAEVKVKADIQQKFEQQLNEREPRFVPRWADGVICATGVGLILMSFVSFGVWVDRYQTAAAQAKKG